MVFISRATPQELLYIRLRSGFRPQAARLFGWSEAEVERAMAKLRWLSPDSQATVIVHINRTRWRGKGRPFHAVRPVAVHARERKAMDRNNSMLIG